MPLFAGLAPNVSIEPFWVGGGGMAIIGNRICPLVIVLFSPLAKVIKLFAVGMFTRLPRAAGLLSGLLPKAKTYKGDGGKKAVEATKVGSPGPLKPFL